MEKYYLKRIDGKRIYFDFSYSGFKQAQKYISEHENELEHPFNDDRVTIYYMNDFKLIKELNN